VALRQEVGVADIDCHLARPWPKEEPRRFFAPSVSGSWAKVWNLLERWGKGNIEQAGSLVAILAGLFAMEVDS
jgi:hypothetical protein